MDWTWYRCSRFLGGSAERIDFFWVTLRRLSRHLLIRILPLLVACNKSLYIESTFGEQMKYTQMSVLTIAVAAMRWRSWRLSHPIRDSPELISPSFNCLARSRICVVYLVIVEVGIYEAIAVWRDSKSFAVSYLFAGRHVGGEGDYIPLANHGHPTLEPYQ